MRCACRASICGLSFRPLSTKGFCTYGAFVGSKIASSHLQLGNSIGQHTAEMGLLYGFQLKILHPLWDELLKIFSYIAHKTTTSPEILLITPQLLQVFVKKKMARTHHAFKLIKAGASFI